MTKINISYHMEQPGEVAESAITLPMEDEVAASILVNEEQKP